MGADLLMEVRAGLGRSRGEMPSGPLAGCPERDLVKPPDQGAVEAFDLAADPEPLRPDPLQASAQPGTGRPWRDP